MGPDVSAERCLFTAVDSVGSLVYRRPTNCFAHEASTETSTETSPLSKNEARLLKPPVRPAAERVSGQTLVYASTLVADRAAIQELQELRESRSLSRGVGATAINTVQSRGA